MLIGYALQANVLRAAGLGVEKTGYGIIDIWQFHSDCQT